MNDSNPGTLTSSVGGVGYNVSLAYKYSAASLQFPTGCRLVSAVGDDFAGHSILRQLQAKKIDTSAIAILPAKTAQYSAIVDAAGLLVVACADMAIMEHGDLPPHLARHIAAAQPKLVVVDCNLSARGLDAVVEAAGQLSHRAKVIVEPTSAPKLARVAGLNSARLRVFPHNQIDMITPTADELERIHASFARRELFDDYDHWFPVLDSMGIDSSFRDRMGALGAKNTAMASLLSRGVLQQCFQLLPYIPTILVKLGAQGCVVASLNTSVSDYKSVPTTSPYAPQWTVVSQGREVEEGHYLGVVVQYFPVPTANEKLDIVDVTGAGDLLVGSLSSSLAKTDWLTPQIESLEHEWGKWELVHRAQLASGKTLMSAHAVAPEIADL